MPRVRIEFDQHRSAIEEWITEGDSHEEAREKLYRLTGVKCSRATFARRLADWNIITKQKVDKSLEVYARIGEIFREYNLTDTETLRILNHEGFNLNLTALRRLRRELGLHKKVDSSRQQEISEIIRRIIREELDSGRIEDFGRAHLYTYMRSKYNMIGRDRMYQVVRELNPEAVARRRSRAQERRGQYILPGPNYLWSIDAYCKLEHWGIQIYAGIDGYSRYITWFYVGISGRTAVSVLGQYIATIRKGHVIPHILRSDRGAETPIAADAHYALSQAVRPRPDGAPIEFSDAFKFGTSKQNSRIESWWRQQSSSTLLKWREYFLELSKNDEYNSNWISDRIAFLAIYVSIIREELMEFVKIWNLHKIRKQPNRPATIPGIPSVLYHHPYMNGATDHGEYVPEDLPKFQEIQQDLEGIDLDEYLPQTTLQWCQDVLLRNGFPSEIDGSSTDSNGQRLHRLAYFVLRDEARLHERFGAEPQLQESEKPYNARRWTGNWQPSEAVSQAFRAAGERLVEDPHPLGDVFRDDFDEQEIIVD